jgi:hypothetical protein
MKVPNVRFLPRCRSVGGLVPLHRHHGRRASSGPPGELATRPGAGLWWERAHPGCPRGAPTAVSAAGRAGGGASSTRVTPWLKRASPAARSRTRSTSKPRSKPPRWTRSGAGTAVRSSGGHASAIRAAHPGIRRRAREVLPPAGARAGSPRRRWRGRAGAGQDRDQPQVGLPTAPARTRETRPPPTTAHRPPTRAQTSPATERNAPPPRPHSARSPRARTGGCRGGPWSGSRARARPRPGRRG